MIPLDKLLNRLQVTSARDVVIEPGLPSETGGSGFVARSASATFPVTREEVKRLIEAGADPLILRRCPRGHTVPAKLASAYPCEPCGVSYLESETTLNRPGTGSMEPPKSARLPFCTVEGCGKRGANLPSATGKVEHWICESGHPFDHEFGKPITTPIDFSDPPEPITCPTCGGEIFRQANGSYICKQGHHRLPPPW